METLVEENYLKFLVDFSYFISGFSDLNCLNLLNRILLISIMPSTRAKAPLSATKKKSLSATTVHAKKRSSQKTSQADGSYLQVRSDTVTVSAPPHSFASVSQVAGVPDPNQAILSALSRLQAANQDLARRMERMERGGSTNSIPVQTPQPRETVSFNLPQGSRLGRHSSPIAPQRTHSQAQHGGGGKRGSCQSLVPTQCISNNFTSLVIRQHVHWPDCRHGSQQGRHYFISGCCEEYPKHLIGWRSGSQPSHPVSFVPVASCQSGSCPSYGEDGEGR